VKKETMLSLAQEEGTLREQMGNLLPGSQHQKGKSLREREATALLRESHYWGRSVVLKNLGGGGDRKEKKKKKDHNRFLIVMGKVLRGKDDSSRTRKEETEGNPLPLKRDALRKDSRLRPEVQKEFRRGVVKEGAIASKRKGGD